MQIYTVAWQYMDPETPPGNQAGDEEVYLKGEADAVIDGLRSALKSTSHVLAQLLLRNAALDRLAKEALAEADKALGKPWTLSK